MKMALVSPKLKEEFSINANDTYKYLEELMKHNCTKYGLFEFPDITPKTGFIYHGEIDKSNVDFFMF